MFNYGLARGVRRVVPLSQRNVKSKGKRAQSKIKDIMDGAGIGERRGGQESARGGGKRSAVRYTRRCSDGRT